MNQSQLRVFVLQAADEYLIAQPSHSFGFCWYATSYIARQLRTHRDNVAGVYDLVGDIMKLLGYGYAGYVGGEGGCTYLRLQFVEDLRAFLINDQD